MFVQVMFVILSPRFMFLPDVYCVRMNRFSFLTFCSIDIDVGYKIAIFVKAIEGAAASINAVGCLAASMMLLLLKLLFICLKVDLTTINQS